MVDPDTAREDFFEALESNVKYLESGEEDEMTLRSYNDISFNVLNEDDEVWAYINQNTEPVEKEVYQDIIEETETEHAYLDDDQLLDELLEEAYDKQSLEDESTFNPVAAIKVPAEEVYGELDELYEAIEARMDALPTIEAPDGSVQMNTKYEDGFVVPKHEGYA